MGATGLAGLRKTIRRGNIFSDVAYGNCVAVLNKGGSPRLMLAAHADEIAMTVNYISDDGYLYVLQRGGVDAAIMKAQRVNIRSTRPGVKTVKARHRQYAARHLQPANEGTKGHQDARSLHRHWGVKNRKEAASLVQIRDLITLDAHF